MALTEAEKTKLLLFGTIQLTQAQVEAILGRTLSKNEWLNYQNKPVKKHKRSEASKLKRKFKAVARQAASSAIKRNMKWNEEAQKTRNERYHKRYRDVAKEAAESGQKRLARTNIEQSNKLHFVKSLFKESTKYNIEKIREYYVDKFRTNLSEWKILGKVNLFNIHQAIRDLIDRMTANLAANVRIKVGLITTQNGDIDVSSKILTKAQINDVLSEWVNYFMDYKDVDLGEITFRLMAIEIPNGAGSKRANRIIDVSKSRCIIQIKNIDTLCLVKSIIVAMSVNNVDKLQAIFKGMLDEDEIKAINFRRKNKTEINEGIISKNELVYLRDDHIKKLLHVLSIAFHRIYKIEIKACGNDFSDIKIIEQSLDIEVQVYDLSKKLIYQGLQKDIKLYILLNNKHFDVISNFNAFLGLRTDQENEKLKCKACCSLTQCDVLQHKVSCDKCFRLFYGKDCYNNHIANNKCSAYAWYCEKCRRIFKSKEREIIDHKCGELKCPNCNIWYLGEHKCFMKNKTIKYPSEKYIFYDFETTIVGTKHVVNYCVAQYFNEEQAKKCNDTFERIFANINDFCKWVFDHKHDKYTCIAHYGKGYDFQFVAEWLISRGIKPTIINNGQKILLLEVKSEYNIRFIDSISFTQQALRSFPKTFGLTELAKGYFPHAFNTVENQNYIGEYPSKEMYGYNKMIEKDKKDFDDWYYTVKDKQFDFKQEMYKYCKSDVDIMRRGCQDLREKFIEIARIDPFQYITIASVCMDIYRSTFMPKNTISVYKETPSDNYSIKSIKWLKYLSVTEGINIKHACNGGEPIINVNGKRLKVDGAYGTTVYQFHGCYFHGCKKCYTDLTVNKISHKYMSELQTKTAEIDKSIMDAGYKLVTICEHDFDNNKDMKNTTLTEYDLIESPKIRDSFFGGRTEPFKLIYDFKEKQEKGRYIDVCSLYPTVMYYDRYPIGHPEKIIKPNDHDPNWFGFIYCKVLPPRGLYLPVLPYKQKSKDAHKLLFGLCRCCMNELNQKCYHNKKVKCAENCSVKSCQACKSTRKVLKQNCTECYSLRNQECSHTSAQREITGFWTTAEVNKAVEKGYQIIDIYEVWHFRESSTELWKGYIRKFLKIKLEASEFECSEQDYRNKARTLDIELGVLKPNPGLRFIAKLCLNSLWGKFGQNPKVKHNQYIDDPKAFVSLVLDETIENLSISFLGDSMAYVSYEVQDRFLTTNYNTNIFVACYTTSWARLRLYDMIERLDRHMCYCDTDGIVYIENEQTKFIYDTFIGDSLGEWTDELHGNHIDFWCCAQPKDYGYITSNNKQCGKVKGFRVNNETENKMTIEARKDLIKGVINTVDINYNMFVIKQHQIHTQVMTKQWAFKFDKRRIVKVSENEIDTVPFGY